MWGTTFLIASTFCSRVTMQRREEVVLNLLSLSTNSQFFCLDALDLKKCLTLANLGRFGIKGSGLTYEAKFNWANWTRPVANWVCGYEPYLGVVIYDCIPEDKVPLWCFKC